MNPISEPIARIVSLGAIPNSMNFSKSTVKMSRSCPKPLKSRRKKLEMK
jgi:hypothetical protein